MEKVQNATAVRRELMALWDMVVDLQDQVSTVIALLETPEKIDPEATAYIYRPGQMPEKVNLVQYAKEVMAGADRQEKQ